MLQCLSPLPGPGYINFVLGPRARGDTHQIFPEGVASRGSSPILNMALERRVKVFCVTCSFAPDDLFFPVIITAAVKGTW